MKTTITTLMLLFFSSLFVITNAQIIYVDSASTAQNPTGESWDEAFQDLQDALAAVPVEGDEIWVAQGTYTPDTMNGVTFATFFIADDIVLLGGFNGTEDSASQRNPMVNLTILSGDLNGDDVDTSFVLNRIDNVMTVVTLDFFLTNETVIDGFTIQNGHADGSDASNSQQRGAGIYAAGSAPIINQCTFRRNYAEHSGGGVFLSQSGSQGAIVQNCHFEENRADAWVGGAGLHAREVGGEGVIVEKCIFESNEGGRGSGLASYDSSLQIFGSSFFNNINVQQGGGLWFNGQTANLSAVVDSCTFENNSASFGGGMYFLALNNNISLQLTNTTFKGNYVTPNDQGWGQGGGALCMYIDEDVTNTETNIENCVFMGNSSTQDGGGIECYNEGDFTDLYLKNCSFTGNQCINNGSAFWTSLSGENVNLEINNCHFGQNVTENFSSAVDLWGTNGGSGLAIIDSCTFESNISFRSGALEIGNGWNGGASVDYIVTNSMFSENIATAGGAVGLWSNQQSTTDILMDNCVFDGNQASIEGGAIVFGLSGNNLSTTISRSQFINNENYLGGGVIEASQRNPGTPYFDNISLKMENCLVANNAGTSGTIVLDSTALFSMINCTVANNTSDGIKISDKTGLILQNTILYNNGNVEFEDLTEDGIVVSNGGNLIGDNSFAEHSEGLDLHDEDPLFEGTGDNCEYYQLSEDSPAVDAGAPWDNAPEYDLCGNDRVINCLDIGALESEYAVITECILSNKKVYANESLIISPNPAFDYLFIELPETILEPMEVSLFDFQGRLMDQFILSENQVIKLKDLPPGMYVLKAIDDEKIYTGKFVKQ